MTKMRAILTAGLIVFALAGCAPEEANEARALVTETPEASTAPEPAPIPEQQAEPVEDVDDPTFGKYTQDEFFILSIGPSFRGGTPTDEQFVSAGLLACEQLQAGVPSTEVRVVEGSGVDADWNNTNLVLGAINVYCPDMQGR